MGVNVIDYSGASATNRGTKIVRDSSGGLDKNAFLTILCAELGNQDPTSNIDSTQYVSQLAQFTSMEQMANLNDTLTRSSYESLLGKGVTVNELDANGVKYTGVVQKVTTTSTGGFISLAIATDKGTEYLDFDIKSIESVLNVSDATLSPLTSIYGNTAFLLASSFMGKDVELSDKDADGKSLKGVVKSVYKEDGAIKVKVQLNNGEYVNVTHDKIVKVGDLSEGTSTDSSKDEAVTE